MGLTVNQTPQPYMPAYNEIIFQATSTNYTQPNHAFIIKITDLITGEFVAYQIEADPIYFSCVFDAGRFARQWIKHYMPLNGLSGWQKCADSIRKVRVNIGESYGSPSTYYPGSDFDFIVWNSIVDFLPYAQYNYQDYVYNATVPRYRFFQGLATETAYPLRSSFIYCLQEASAAASTPGIAVLTYNAAGSLIGTSNIANPYASGSVYTDKYVCIDVGHKGLSTIPSGAVTGTYPIITASVARYEVYDLPLINLTLIKSFTIALPCQYTVMTVHFLAKDGHFGTCHFNLISENNITKDGQTYKLNPNQNDGVNYGYNGNQAVETDFNTSTQTVLTLRTDWLTDDQVTKYKDLFSSNLIYLDLGAVRSVRVRQVTKQYSDIPYYNQPLRQLEQQFYYSHQNYSQDV